MQKSDNSLFRCFPLLSVAIWSDAFTCWLVAFFTSFFFLFRGKRLKTLALFESAKKGNTGALKPGDEPNDSLHTSNCWLNFPATRNILHGEWNKWKRSSQLLLILNVSLIFTWFQPSAILYSCTAYMLKCLITRPTKTKSLFAAHSSLIHFSMGRKLINT